MNPDPDYSAAYVVLEMDDPARRSALALDCGRHARSGTPVSPRDRLPRSRQACARRRVRPQPPRPPGRVRRHARLRESLTGPPPKIHGARDILLPRHGPLPTLTAAGVRVSTLRVKFLVQRRSGFLSEFAAFSADGKGANHDRRAALVSRTHCRARGAVG